jgi:hypothetical protein
VCVFVCARVNGVFFSNLQIINIIIFPLFALISDRLLILWRTQIQKSKWNFCSYDVRSTVSIGLWEFGHDLTIFAHLFHDVVVIIGFFYSFIHYFIYEIMVQFKAHWNERKFSCFIINIIITIIIDVKKVHSIIFWFLPSLMVLARWKVKLFFFVSLLFIYYSDNLDMIVCVNASYDSEEWKQKKKIMKATLIVFVVCDFFKKKHKKFLKSNW